MVLVFQKAIKTLMKLLLVPFPLLIVFNVRYSDLAGNSSDYS